jgi:hypothetical protein
MIPAIPSTETLQEIRTWRDSHEQQVFGVLDSSRMPREVVQLILSWAFPTDDFLYAIADKADGLGNILQAVLQPPPGSLIDRCLGLPELRRWDLIPSIAHMWNEQGQLEPVKLSILLHSGTNTWVPRIHYLRVSEARDPNPTYNLISYLPYPCFIPGDTEPFYFSIHSDYKTNPELLPSEQVVHFAEFSLSSFKLTTGFRDSNFPGENVSDIDPVRVETLLLKRNCQLIAHWAHVAAVRGSLHEICEDITVQRKNGLSPDPNQFFKFGQPNGAPLQLGLPQGMGDDLPPAMQGGQTAASPASAASAASSPSSTSSAASAKK